MIIWFIKFLVKNTDNSICCKEKEVPNECLGMCISQNNIPTKFIEKDRLQEPLTPSFCDIIFQNQIDECNNPITRVTEIQRKVDTTSKPSRFNKFLKLLFDLWKNKIFKLRLMEIQIP